MKTGTVISHYDIVGELGRGGMGVVYRAEDTKLRRTVALKLLSAHMLGSESDRSRFYREARAAAGLQHPNIATVYEIDESGDQVFIALEFVEGRSLDQLIEEGPLPLEKVIQIGIQLADGLTHAHERDIVHRDIKSGNVMLTKKGDVKIMDFGLAKSAASTKLTQYGSTLGTIAYMSPEQARGEEVDGRSDLWSLGVMLYEMISGKMPFPGDYEQAVIYGILNDEPKPLTSIRTGVPMELERIVNKCLRKDIALRYQHADEIASDLKAVILAKPSTISAPSTASGPDNHQRPDGRWARRALIWGLPLALIAGILLGRFVAPKTPNKALSVHSMARVTSEQELDINPALSPDGTMIAYVSGDPNDAELFVKQVDGGNRVSVAPSARGVVAEPTWSPDGNRLAFRSDGSIFLVPALGGIPEPLILRSPDGPNYRSPAWSPDGGRIAVSSGDSVFVIDVATRTARSFGSVSMPYALAWSPDGSRIAGVAGNQYWNDLHDFFSNIANSSLWTLDVASGRIESIPGVSIQNETPVFNRSGDGLYFLASSGGLMDLYFQRLDRDGRAEGETARLTVGLDAHALTVDAARSRIAYPKVNLRRNVWRVRIDPDRVVSTREAEPVTSGANIVEALAVSPDGMKIAYDSNVRGNQDVYMKTIGGPDVIQLTSDPANDFVSTWSDEQSILFYSLRRGQRDVYRIDTETRHEELLVDADVELAHPSMSSDGQSLAYQSYGQGVPARIGLSTRLEDGSWSRPEFIVEAGGIPRWSPSQDVLAYEEEESVVMLDAATGETNQLPAPGLSIHQINWSREGDTVYLHARENDSGMSGIWSIAAKGGKLHQIMTYDEPNRGFGYHYFAVSKGFVYFTLKEAESDIWVMDVETD